MDRGNTQKTYMPRSVDQMLDRKHRNDAYLHNPQLLDKRKAFKHAACISNGGASELTPALWVKQQIWYGSMLNV
jgi:hypothetical protein